MGCMSLTDGFSTDHRKRDLHSVIDVVYTDEDVKHPGVVLILVTGSGLSSPDIPKLCSVWFSFALYLLLLPHADPIKFRGLNLFLH